jgi:hypothetical protein
MSAPRYCQCPAPNVGVVEGVRVCEHCGELESPLALALAQVVAGPLAELRQRLERIEQRIAVPPPPRLSLTRQEAADAMGWSLDSFERYCQPELRLVRKGANRLVLVKDLERWLERNAEEVIRRQRPAA